MDLAAEHDALVLSDEVYEPFTFGGREHVRTASLCGAADRTLTLGSAGKLFSLTGWRVGWAVSSNTELERERSLQLFVLRAAAYV